MVVRDHYNRALAVHVVCGLLWSRDLLDSHFHYEPFVVHVGVCGLLWSRGLLIHISFISDPFCSAVVSFLWFTFLSVAFCGPGVFCDPHFIHLVINLIV